MKNKKLAKSALALLMSSALSASTLALTPMTAFASQVSVQSSSGTLSQGTFSYTTDPSGNITSLDIILDPIQLGDNSSDDLVDIPPIVLSENPSFPINITINEELYKYGKDIYVPVVNANTSTVSMVKQADGSEKPAVFDAYIAPSSNPYDHYAGNYKIHLTGSESLTLKNNAKKFWDVSPFLDTYPSKEIAFMSARDLMSGVDANHFSPNTYVNRGQIATILFRRAGEPAIYDNDPLPAGVSSTDFYARASKWAVGKGLMAKGSNFNGGTPITREQFAVILYRLIPVPKQVGESIFQEYPDLSQMSNFMYMNAFAYLIQDGIMGQGTHSIRPQAYCTRAEVAAMLSRWIPQSTNEALYSGAVSII